MSSITPELIGKVKGATSAEELYNIASSNGVELTAEKAKMYYLQLNPELGELSDDILDAVSGGAGCSKNGVSETMKMTCPYCSQSVTGKLVSASGSELEYECPLCHKSVYF